MRCPTLYELPPPPPCKAGWPWTEESPQLPDTMPDGSPWPRVSIVTPSYNQGQFIEETIRSVLLQGYPDLECIVMDGGSTDGSVDIIRKYGLWLACWVIERDRGQSHAINKGLGHTTGDVVAWLNADDLYVEGALKLVAEAAVLSPDSLVAGDVVNFDSTSGQDLVEVRQRGIVLKSIVKFWDRSCVWHQPGLFFPDPVLARVGGLREDLHYAMDYELLCRILQHCSVRYVDRPVARFRLHHLSNGVSQPAYTVLEKCAISWQYWHLTELGHARFLMEMWWADHRDVFVSPGLDRDSRVMWTG